MNLAPERLAEHLAKGLAPLYTVYGDEALIAIEAADSVRAAARAAGYTERTIYSVQGRYNWNAIFAAGDNFSLFAERRLCEIRLASGKPGTDGSRALETYCSKLPPDTVTLVTLPALDWRTTQSRWFAALAATGIAVEAKPVARAQLPGWIERRLARHGLQAAREVLEFLSDRVEGNLLAAQQEVEKLALLLPPGKIALADVEGAVVDVSRREAEQLQDALLQGDTARYARIVADLRDSGEHPIAFLWRLADVVRMLLKLKFGFAAGESLDGLLKQARLREPRRAWVEAALARLGQARLESAQAMLALIDRQAKGLEPVGDAWDTMLRMGLVMSRPARTKNGH